ncbi:MAG TPA: cation acetate symporter [Anaerolineae bacterium]
MSLTLILFLIIVAITLVITYWASRRTQTAKQFYAAGRQITGLQNGIAVAGDYMSAASFLGIAGLIAFNGYDGFMYSVGWLVAYLTVLLIVAEPLRNTGKYTMADVLAFRLGHPSVRSVAAISTLIVSLFYMIAQMVGAGSLVSLLIPQISFEAAIIIVGALMMIYVVFGGMLATTWVQIIKAVLLMTGTLILSIIVLSHFGFSLTRFFAQIATVTKTVPGTTTKLNFTQPGLLYNGRWGALDLISLGVALIFGTAGLPHILMRFYTVPTAKAARTSVVWAMILIGVFYIMTTFLGFGAATLVGYQNIGVLKDGKIIANTNLAAPLLAEKVGGEPFLAFIAAVAFATILAVVAGLTIAASSAFAHDLWLMVIKKGKEDEREQVSVARITALVVGALAIVLGIVLKTANVAFLVGLAFAVAASANLPAIVFSLFWRRFNTVGTVSGMLTGLIASVLLILASPTFMGKAAIFPLNNPGIVSVPLGFLGAYLGTVLSRRDPVAEQAYSELNVRANTGLGAEV